MDAMLAGMKTTLISFTSPLELLDDEVHIEYSKYLIIFWKESFFFPWAVGLNSELAFGGAYLLLICALPHQLAFRILVPWAGIEPLQPWQWKHQILTTGLTGNSHNGGLKIFSKSCCNVLSPRTALAVPLIDYGQSRFSLLLKDPKTFGTANEHWLQPKVWTESLL